MNVHTCRIAWLREATKQSLPDFERLGLVIPDNIDYSVAFPPGGKNGKVVAILWPKKPGAKIEIYFHADQDDPIVVLTLHRYALLKVVLGEEEQHGKLYQELAKKLGVKSPVSFPRATPDLLLRLQEISDVLGPFPHHGVDSGAAEALTKGNSGSKTYAAKCQHSGCGYAIRLCLHCARQGLPQCPNGRKHGKLTSKALEQALAAHADDDVVGVVPLTNASDPDCADESK